MNIEKVFYCETYMFGFFIFAIVSLQLLVYELLKSKGYNPDIPRNLTKVVFVD